MNVVAKPASPKKPEIAVTIVVDPTVDTPTYYMNHVEIAVNQHEMALWFARLPTKPGRDQVSAIAAAGEIVIEPEFQILIPPTLAEGLISALQKSIENYEEAFGPIREIEK